MSIAMFAAFVMICLTTWHTCLRDVNGKSCGDNQLDKWELSDILMPYNDSLQLIGYDADVDSDIMHVIGGNLHPNLHYSLNLRTGAVLHYPNITNGEYSHQGITINNIVYFFGYGLKWYDLSDPTSTTFSHSSNTSDGHASIPSTYFPTMTSDDDNVLFLFSAEWEYNNGSTCIMNAIEANDSSAVCHGRHVYKYMIDSDTFIKGPIWTLPWSGAGYSESEIRNSDYGIEQTCEYFEATDQILCFTTNAEDAQANLIRYVSICCIVYVFTLL